MGEKGAAPRSRRCLAFRLRVIALITAASLLAACGLNVTIRLIKSRSFDQPLPPPVIAAVAMRGASAALDALRQAGTPLHVVIDAQYGLGNRLRAVASAMAVAAAAKRPLLVVWVPDAHANCSLRTLLDAPLPFALLEEPVDMSTLESSKFQPFNYMPAEGGAGGTRREWVRLDASRHLFVRSAYRVAHERGEWPYTMRKLRQLRPRPHVRERVLSDASMIGLHVRGVVDAISDYGSNGTRALASWRSKTTWRAFVERMKAEPPSRKFYLAADSAEAYAGLSTAFPGQIVHADAPQHCLGLKNGARCDTERGCEAMEGALVDLLNLARTGRILGSFYSSFSEVARYLGSADVYGNELPFEAAGQDF